MDLLPVPLTESIDNGYAIIVERNYIFNGNAKICSFAQYFNDQYLDANTRAGVTLSSIQWATTNNFNNPNQGSKGYGYVYGWGISVWNTSFSG